MLHQSLEQRLRAAVASLLPQADLSAVQVRPAADTKFGDYQSNALMALAKQQRLNPRQLATQVVEKLDVSDLCEPVEIAGPGFLNFRLRPAALSARLAEAARGEHLFFRPTVRPRTIVIDFSSPNVAKPMHVGHIRSTGIGDCLQRVLRLLGHRVISDNHLGDWGTQFGKLLVGWKGQLDRAALASDPIGEMERLYRVVNAACESDPAVLEQARQELVRLQAGDPENLAIWKEMLRLSQDQFDTLYRRLGVTFDHTLGESFYNPQLGAVVADLLGRGIARESEGAVGVFSERTLPPKEDPFLVNRDGEWIDDPALVRKSDGGFNYMTTDLATVDYRIRTWSPDEILYVVDDRQAPHFRKLFLTFARWQPEAAARVGLRHIGFGKILGDDGRPFRTRSGDTIRLAGLLDEAEERALAVVQEKRPELPEAEQAAIARVVGLGSVKYQDLLPNRQSDYVFSWDKMLALTGNTAPYLQYQFTRAHKVARDGGAYDVTALDRVVPEDPAELALTRHLLNFGLTLEAVGEECRPNYLCNYLYELAGLYSRFYENCPVLKSEGDRRVLRLALCDLTARVLRQGLTALGIETTEVM
ncbi:MAG: hypothetical protein RLZ45_1327 [Verrucomicrobiota bacterium]|jgi:arginyl-tRNA synthetase